MTHTKGRAVVENGEGYSINRLWVGQRLLAQVVGDDAEADNNTARIVALWNAAEELGLTTEAIEAGAIQAAFDSQAEIDVAAGQAAWGDVIRSLTKGDSK